MKKFKIPIYDMHIWFSMDRDELWKIVNKKDMMKEAENFDYCDGATIVQTGESIIYVGVFDSRMSTLAHELIHVAMRVCQTVGIEMDINNQEPFAYLYTWLFEKLEKEVMKNGNRGEARFNKATEEK